MSRNPAATAAEIAGGDSWLHVIHTGDRWPVVTDVAVSLDTRRIAFAAERSRPVAAGRRAGQRWRICIDRFRQDLRLRRVRISHAPGYQSIPDPVRVSAPIRSTTTCRRWERYWLCRRCVATPTTVRCWSYAELNAITIATPHHLHAEHAMDEEAGVAVISEKPIATSVEQAR